MSRAMASISEAMAAVDECKLSDKAKKELKSKMMMARQDIGANQKFVADQLGDGTHTLRIEVRSDNNAASKGTIAQIRGIIAEPA